MADTTFDKKPAFFRVATFEMFFEAESADSKAAAANLAQDVDLDAELDAILG
ncbi:MAG: hypothetical protein NTV28_04385 [Propionibacteriales bacterium]|nr:hypothetical protein [Propionibacteriales bacterium]